MNERIMRLNLVVLLFQGKILQEGGAAAPTLLNNFPFPEGRGLRGWGTKTLKNLNI